MSTKSDQWCIFVSFHGTSFGNLKVPVKSTDSCHDLLTKVLFGLKHTGKPIKGLIEFEQARERAKATLANAGPAAESKKNSETVQIDTADCLVDGTGATLFYGDPVGKVLGCHHQDPSHTDTGSLRIFNIVVISRF